MELVHTPASEWKSLHLRCLRPEPSGTGAEFAAAWSQGCLGRAPVLIDLLSFICLYPQDWQTRSYLALGGVSGKALDRFLSERKDTRKVFLCLDSDTAGGEACFRLAQDIPSEIAVIRLVPARKDWNDVLRQDVYKRQVLPLSKTRQESRMSSMLQTSSMPAAHVFPAQVQICLLYTSPRRARRGSCCPHLFCPRAFQWRGHPLRGSE